MKRLLLLVLALSLMPLAYAVDTANIKININGAVHDNTYFLCMPNFGCYSIMQAKKGKIYRINHDVQMNTMFVTNQDTYRIHRQGLPTSCNVAVKTKQTITIHGTLTVGANDSVQINQLHCSLSG